VHDSGRSSGSGTLTNPGSNTAPPSDLISDILPNASGMCIRFMRVDYTVAEPLFDATFIFN
jgi:hypothetical protein